VREIWGKTLAKMLAPDLGGLQRAPTFYVTKAVNAKGTESTASNEVRADIPSK